MSILGRKPKMSIEEFCRQFYDSKVFYVKTHDENGPSTLWESSLNLFAEADPSLAEVDRDLFRREITALHMELFGLAWIHYLLSELLRKRDIFSEWSYVSQEQEQLSLSEINFTKAYLQENNHSDVWDYMGAYNEALAVASWRYSRASKDGLSQEWVKQVGFDGASRLMNRLGIKHIRQSSEKSSFSEPLATTFANRVGWNIKHDSKLLEDLEYLVDGLYLLAKDLLESVDLLTLTQFKFNQPLALQISRVLTVLVGLSSFVLVPIMFISIHVIAAVSILTFGLLHSILNLIWVPLFLGPLLGLSWLWKVLPTLRIPIAFIGVPLAFMAHAYIVLVGSLMPWGHFGSKAADLALCESWPFSRDFLAFEMGMVPRHSERFTNLAPVLSRVRHRNPILESYLDDAEVNPRPPLWFLNYLIQDLIQVACAGVAFYFLFRIHWILAVIAVIPIQALIGFIVASVVFRVKLSQRLFYRSRQD